MSETKDQTIARLEGELKLAKRYDGRQVPNGVCDHSTDCNIWGDDGQGKVNGEYISIPCSCGAHWNWAKKLEAELAASRADAIQMVAMQHPEHCVWGRREGDGRLSCKCGFLLDNPPVTGQEIPVRFLEHQRERILALITATDAAARDDRDRRIRLEEHALLCPKCSIFPSAESGCKRFIELRAPVPAERDEFNFISEKFVRCLKETVFALSGMQEPFRSGGLTALEELAFRFTGIHFDSETLPVPAERAGDAVCPTCKGEMTIMTKEAGSGHSDDLAEYEFCPDCHGTGRAK